MFLQALRLAMNLTKRAQVIVQVFLIGDGVNCAIANQITPNGYHNSERIMCLNARRGKVAT